MILPIIGYGNKILKQNTASIEPKMEGLPELIADMWETMYNAEGVGLAAPQIGKSIRLFVVDTEQAMDDDKKSQGIKKVFINAEIVKESGKPWSYEEGCLSIPKIRGDVERQPDIVIKYQDENFNNIEESYSGLNARVIQHEYDHTLGKLFIDYLKPIKKRLIKRKLEQIRNGDIDVHYRVNFAKR